MLTMDSEFGPDDFGAKYFDCGPRQTYIEKLDKLRSFIPEHAGSLAGLAIKFVLKDPGVTSALVSMHVKKFAEETCGPLTSRPFPTKSSTISVVTTAGFEISIIPRFYKLELCALGRTATRRFLHAARSFPDCLSADVPLRAARPHRSARARSA